MTVTEAAPRRRDSRPRPMASGTLGRRLSYIFLTISILPIIIGYSWLVIATVSTRTQGLLPRNAEGGIGGLTLSNWDFVFHAEIWNAMLNSLLIAVAMVIGVGIASTSGGYALSRFKFPGRKAFLTGTLVLHAFKAEMLLIAIFFVLRFLGDIPLIGPYIGFNSVGGVALVMVALELPLGIWLMKGFFDNLSWDMERAALIDGASRFRVWWQIMLPQIRAGLASLPVFLAQMITDTAPLNWNAVAAVGLFQMIPVLVFFLFTQEKLLSIYGSGSKGGA